MIVRLLRIPAALALYGAFKLYDAMKDFHVSRGPRGPHVTHWRDEQPVYDQVPFPGAPHPARDALSEQEWAELERRVIG